MGARYHLCLTFVDVLCLVCSPEQREIEQDAETMRFQLLGDPNLMLQLERVRPCNPVNSVCQCSSQNSHRSGPTRTSKRRTFRPRQILPITQSVPSNASPSRTRTSTRVCPTRSRPFQHRSSTKDRRGDKATGCAREYGTCFGIQP